MMTKREIAERYLQCFCGSDIEGLVPLLAHDLQFTGPFHSFNSAEDYLESLKRDPPEHCDYKILSATENEESVALFYEYRKPKQIMSIAQLFRIETQKIQEILLVFDRRIET